MNDLFENQQALIDHTSFSRVTGRVHEVTGLTIVAEGLPLSVGAMCTIETGHGGPMAAQVVGIRGHHAVLMTLGDPNGVAVGDRVISTAGLQHVGVGRQMLGTILDGLGRPIGGRTEFSVEWHYPIYRKAPAALTREPIVEPLSTGISSVDAMHTVGCGQRLGIFAGTGVGKSVMLGMIARHTSADVNVVALVGERGREVGDFIRRDLGEEGASRTVLVVSTSDQSPVLRVRAGFVATAVAEYFRDLGKNVLLMMDSTTRIAMAQRQIGLSAGEPPTTKGYPPSVFGLLPTMLERSGRTSKGSITGLYTVLVEGDDITEPISDAVRGILDGHVWLSRDLANRGHYPAVSVLESISRVMPDLVSRDHLAAAANVRKVLAVWADIEDLVNIGAYAAGTNIEFDVAVDMKPTIDAFLQQAINEHMEWTQVQDELLTLSSAVEKRREALAGRSPSRTVAATA